eukprot:CAMPEP_0196599358 /NCGR_PEP_ID=MMETSP1081-20130531/94816_1 /TAXON_ID=36882 /ORGANISM="Pyramimonas amylifera, Strain CCMP720" /LENGTH=128 /DNA_ID=CAMNT_0041925125 /DNA_START=582 /DNA_END=965 /DNA_ORIENTATION=+
MCMLGTACWMTIGRVCTILFTFVKTTHWIGNGGEDLASVTWVNLFHAEIYNWGRGSSTLCGKGGVYWAWDNWADEGIGGTWICPGVSTGEGGVGIKRGERGRGGRGKRALGGEAAERGISLRDGNIGG